MEQRILFASILLTLSSPAWPGNLDEVKQLIEADENNQALVQIDNQLVKQPDDPEILFLRAITLSKLQRKQEAIELYHELINQHPTLPEPRNNLAVLYAQQGEFEASEQALQSALNTHPSYATAHRNLSDIYKTLASIAYNKALDLDNGREPSPPETKLQLITELRSHHNGASADVIPLPATGPAEAVANPRKEAASLHPEMENAADLNDIGKVISSWATAWSEQDVKRYLSHYSPDFIPDNRLSRLEWEELRRQRLLTPDFVRVEVSQLETVILDNRIASVSLDQQYRSDRFSELSHKIVLLRHENGRWRIIQETETK